MSDTPAADDELELNYEDEEGVAEEVSVAK